MMGLDVDAWCFFATRWTGRCSCSIIDHTEIEHASGHEGIFEAIDGIRMASCKNQWDQWGCNGSMERGIALWTAAYVRIDLVSQIDEFTSIRILRLRIWTSILCVYRLVPAHEFRLRRKSGGKAMVHKK
jgi:hypothetical protein